MSLQGIFDPVAREVLTKPYNDFVRAKMANEYFSLKSNVEGEIATYAFIGEMKLASVDFPNATSIGGNAFDTCQGLKSVRLHSAISVGRYAFLGCSDLTNIDLPSATSIGDYAFKHCDDLTSISLPSATSIGEGAFEALDIENVDLPSCVSIGYLAFHSCGKLTNIVLPSATSIGESAFDGCSSLETVDLPSCEIMGAFAFGKNEKLAAVILRTTKTVCVADLSAFYNTPLLQGMGHIYVPSSMYESYRAVYETAVNADTPGFFDILFRKIEDYPEITGEAT